MWKWLKKMWDKMFKPKPEPEPTNPAAGFRVRCKTYKPPYHKDRRFSAKIDTRFHTELGLTGDNAALTVDGVALEYYGIDMENGKHDLCFCDKKRKHTDLPRPVSLRIFKNGAEVAEIVIPEWKYQAVYVEGVQ